MQHYCEIPTPKGVMRGFFHQPDLKEFPVCIMFHGFTGVKSGPKFSFVQLARMLEARGVATLRMDFLGSGESDLNFKDMTFGDELSCARVLLEEVLKMPVTTKVYILGHSMGGAIASELAKLYPNDIQKLCLWAPAFHLPQLIQKMMDVVQTNEDGIYDYEGYELSQQFGKDIIVRDFFEGLNIYQNELFVIHGNLDELVPFEISKTYLPLMSKHTKFLEINGGSHSFSKITDIKLVLKKTLNFLEEKR